MNEPTGSEKEPSANTLAPLEGEPGLPKVAQPGALAVSKKELLLVVLLVLSLVVVGVNVIRHLTASDKKTDETLSKKAGDRPAAATLEPRRLDLSAPASSMASSAPAQAPRIPAIVPTDDELAEPIGVHRTGQSVPAQSVPAPSGPKAIPPEDAPAVLVSSRAVATAAPGTAGRGASLASPANQGADSDPLAETRRNLEAYERQLQVLLDSLTERSTASSPRLPQAAFGSGAPTGAAFPSSGSAPEASPAGGLFGGQLQGSATPRVAARMLGDRSLVLPKGTTFTCALETKVVSAASGFVGCQVQRNVFGSDGRVLLVERGSKVDGEYRIASVKPGMVRIPVLWTRIRTPEGVTVDIDSPATGPLGESGIDGYVDNRWLERIGAAMLLSLIDDSVQLAVQHESSSSQGNAVILPSTTSNTGKLAEKVLDSTINIPPLIYQNQGGIVGVYVARDVDFSSVYELQPAAGELRP